MTTKTDNKTQTHSIRRTARFPDLRCSRQLAVTAALAAWVCAGCDQADPAEIVPDKPDRQATDGGGAGNKSENGENGDATMPDEPTTAELIYPLVPGSRWVYQHRGGSRPWDEEVELVEETRDGEPALVLKDTPGPNGTRNESVLAVKGTTAYRVKKEQFIGDALLATVEYDPGFVRGDQAWTQQSVGFEETPTYRRREWDSDGVLTRDADRAHIFRVESLDETVSVPAGEFDGCLRVHRVRDRAVGTDPGDGDDKRFWYCPGVGKVREENDVDGSTEELVSCEVPGGACP
ncbi:MAG: hypothetical protein OXU20_13730 [Myxococcales bacterium]|nr:hypothetical protein [Myxococcales bacterium]